MIGERTQTLAWSGNGKNSDVILADFLDVKADVFLSNKLRPLGNRGGAVMLLKTRKGRARR